ncbi:MAG TPA: cell division protein FtsA [Bacteroidia bacterium]|jgi:cell division protein FtsA|nr:cell division protein FtsA [Bacteroidia bacterium]
MENKSEIIVGLDIGTTKIVCIVARKNEHNKIDVMGLGKSDSVGIARGVVMNIDQTVASIMKAIKEAADKSGVEIKYVNVGIAGQHIKSLQHRGIKTRSDLEKEISQQDIDSLIEDMSRLVMPPGEEIIEVLPQEYIVDNESGIKNPIGMAGVRLEANFHIITGQIAAARNIEKCVKKSNLEMSNLTLEALASSDSVLTAEEREAGVVLVDIGGGTTDVAIFHDDIIRHTAVIPFGGNVITDDIKEGCQIIRAQAEQLKVKFGSAIPTEAQENEIVVIPGLKGRQNKEISVRNLSSIINARMEEILEHVYYEIKNSGFEKKLIAGIVVTGGGANLKHLPQLVEYVTGMDTRIGHPNEHLAPGIFDLSHPLYATGVGLVMKGFEETEKETLIDTEQNVIKQPEIVQHSKQKKKGGLMERIFSGASKFFDEDVEGSNK